MFSFLKKMYLSTAELVCRSNSSAHHILTITGYVFNMQKYKKIQREGIDKDVQSEKRNQKNVNIFFCYDT